MTEPSQPLFTPQALEQLQQIRLSVIAFQNTIAALPADQQNDGRSAQFNQLWLEAKALLNEPDFDKRIPKAVTPEVLAERSQRVLLPRLSVILMLGVILALLGLGVNSIILDDFIINSLACLVSSGGMLLVLGAFAVGIVASRRGRVSNLGDLYLSSNALLAEIEQALNRALPGWADPSARGPETISLLELALDSLQRQAADWQHKLRDLEAQQLALGSTAPLDLKLNLHFVERELQRVRGEIDRLQGRLQGQSTPWAPAEQALDSTSVRRAKSATMDMPVSQPEAAAPEESTQARPADES